MGDTLFHFVFPLLALLICAEVGSKFSWRKALKATINRVTEEPLALIVVILMLLGLILTNLRLERQLKIYLISSSK